MAKAKKKAKRKTAAKRPNKPAAKRRAVVPVAVVPTIDTIRAQHVGGTYPTVRAVALPELWCRIEEPVHVTMVEKFRPDTSPQAPGGRKRPAALARVLDLDDKQGKDLAMPTPLAAFFAVIPQDGYVGRSYKITRHRRHERKNSLGFTVVEIEPQKTGDAG